MSPRRRRPEYSRRIRRKSSSASTLLSSRRRELKLEGRLNELEKFKEKTKKKKDQFKWSKPGCEKQFDLNAKIK